MFLTAKIVPFSHIAKPLIWCPVRPRTGALGSVSLDRHPWTAPRAFYKVYQLVAFVTET